MAGTDKKSTAINNLVFVHGTFAQRLSDHGDAWWQQGSQFSQRIEKKLRGVALPSKETFHWSGKNSDIFRVFDASLLLDLLCSENKKGPFQVVAHSHGGMVLFQALMLAVEKGKNLENLRAWVTVGTPFIFYSPSFRRIATCHAPSAFLMSLLVSVLILQFLGSWLIVALFSLSFLTFFLLTFSI